MTTRDEDAAPISMATVTALALGIASLVLMLLLSWNSVPIALALAVVAIIVGAVAGGNAQSNGLSGLWLARIGILAGLLALAVGAVRWMV